MFILSLLRAHYRLRQEDDLQNRPSIRQRTKRYGKLGSCTTRGQLPGQKITHNVDSNFVRALIKE